MVTGSRHYRTRARLYEVCTAVKAWAAPMALFGIAGGALGADKAFEHWCDDHGVPFRPYPAKWKEHHKHAGPIRNQIMIDDGRPDLALGFGMLPDSGTQDAIERAKLAGIPTWVDGPDFARDRLRLESGQIIQHHPEVQCTPPCSIHSPSWHRMREWPRNWRQDRRLMERLCKHGVGHPDPDDLAYRARQAGLEPDSLFFWEGIHGCDGCCAAYQGDEGDPD
jgi:hypothetical protein